MKDLQSIFSIVLSIIALLGLAVAWGRLLEKQKAQDCKIKTNKNSVEKVGVLIHNSLYDTDSLPLYVVKKECSMNQEKCRIEIEKRMSGFGKELASFKVDVRQDLKSMSGEIKTNEEKRITEMVSIREFMSSISTSLNDVKEGMNKRNGDR